MKRKLRFAGWLMARGMSAPLAVPGLAQGPRANGAQNRQENRPPKQQNQPPRQQQRQEQRREHRQQQETRRAQNARPNSGANRPPNPNMNRAETAMRPNNNPNRPLQNLPPAQRQELQDRAQVWNKLTPEQRQHIRSDILPKWQQMPPDRKRAIQQRLGVLKNMPESARNQHLNDPNFTRGMSQEDQATLRDLSHLHVGGSPDPPNE